MNAEMLPFHPDDSSFNRANALYLAHAADVVYCRSPMAAARERLGLRAVAFRHKVNRTRGFLGVCDTHAVLAFREYDGRVHQGFSSVLRRSWGKVEAILEAVGDRPLFLTGHSLGGALAVLTACRLAKMGRAPMATYTFGAPRIGDPVFCARYSLPTYRIVNRLDLVPELPLASLRRMLPEKPRITNEKILRKLKDMAERVPCYGHVRTFVYIDHDGEITTDAEVGPWHAHAVARAIATRGKSFMEGITDHLIANYIRGLEGKPRRKHSHIRRRIHVD
jgi:pimeloyl-ACP methyl ester carboxylesterase